MGVSDTIPAEYERLHVWIPSNRTYGDGRPKAMDGLNEIIADNRTHRMAGAKAERENVYHCMLYIRQAMLRQHWKPMKTRETAQPVQILVTFYEVHDRRDISNVIGGGLKYLLDALSRPRGKQAGAAAIYDDSRKWVTRISPDVQLDPENPGIDVLLLKEARH